MWQAACPVIASVLSAGVRKIGKCDKAQLPENRIFADKVGARIIYGKSIFTSFRRELRRILK